MRLGRILGFRLVTADADKVARFYAALGFEVDEARPIEATELAMLGVAGQGTRRPLRLGAARLDLDQFETLAQPYPSSADAASACFQHLALVASDVGEAWAEAQAAGAMPISRGAPVTLPPNAGGVMAIKFRDPDGHPLELIRFPDAAARGWQGNGLLGIDHSALVATDLAASQAFYTGLGLTRGDATLNRGPTQAALDGLEDVLVDVVPMMPTWPTPHVELLHYRSPSKVPGFGWSATDIAATRIVWHGASPALLRDPDGHFHQVEI